MKTGIVMLVAALCLVQPIFAADTLDILNASKQHGVYVKIEGLGGHSEYCVQITVSNKSKSYFLFRVKPGVLLVPEEDKFQDLLVVENKEIDLKPGQKIVATLRAFCAAHSKSSPKVKAPFEATQGDPNLVSLATYINQNPGTGDIASAVWVVANGISIASISQSNKGMLAIVSELSKQPIPDYTLTYKTSSDRVFSNSPDRLKGDIEYTVVGEDLTSFQIYDEKGRLRKTIYNGKLTRRGLHREEYDIDVSKLKNGTYFLRVYQQNQLIKEKKVVL